MKVNGVTLSLILRTKVGLSVKIFKKLSLTASSLIFKTAKICTNLTVKNNINQTKTQKLKFKRNSPSRTRILLSLRVWTILVLFSLA